MIGKAAVSLGVTVAYLAGVLTERHRPFGTKWAHRNAANLARELAGQRALCDDCTC